MGRIVSGMNAALADWFDLESYSRDVSSFSPSSIGPLATLANDPSGSASDGSGMASLSPRQDFFNSEISASNSSQEDHMAARYEVAFVDDTSISGLEAFSAGTRQTWKRS